MFLLDNKPLPIDTAFTVDGIQYPANWLRLSTAKERKALGVTEIPDQMRPDDRYYWVTDNGDGTFTATPKDLDQLKASAVAQIKTTAGTMLAATDWRVIRATETGTQLDAETATNRAAIRVKSNEFESLINGCESVEELAALTFEW